MNWLFKEEPANYSFDAFVQGQANRLERREEPARPEAPARR